MQFYGVGIPLRHSIMSHILRRTRKPLHRIMRSCATPEAPTDSQQLHLLATAHGPRKEVGAQAIFAAFVHSEASHGKAKSSSDLICERPAASLSDAELGGVISAAVHGLQELDDARCPIREIPSPAIHGKVPLVRAASGVRRSPPRGRRPHARRREPARSRDL